VVWWGAGWLGVGGLGSINKLEGLVAPNPSPKRILVAVAWPYASGPRHLGHVAGFGVPSDIFARYHRLKGNQVLMVSGTDEHGTPIQVQADAEGVTTRELADRYNAIIGQDLAALCMSYDLFTRTTTRNHHAVVQEIFKGLYDNGYIFPRESLAAISPSTPAEVLAVLPGCKRGCSPRSNRGAALRVS